MPFFCPLRPLSPFCRIYAPYGVRPQTLPTTASRTHRIPSRIGPGTLTSRTPADRADCARPFQPGRVESRSTTRRCGFEGPSAHRPELRRAAGREAGPGTATGSTPVLGRSAFARHDGRHVTSSTRGRRPQSLTRSTRRSIRPSVFSPGSSPAGRSRTWPTPCSDGCRGRPEGPG